VNTALANTIIEAAALTLAAIIITFGLICATWDHALLPLARRIAYSHARRMQAVRRYEACERIGRHRGHWGGSLDDQPAQIILDVITDVQARRQP
jgi:hypothetical protein